jgi:hypothetical protein
MMKEIKKISDKNPFRVPEDYFKEINRKIISSTSGYSPEQKGSGLYRKLRPYLAVAASVAILAVLSYAALTFYSSGRNRSELPALTLNEFSDNYLNEIDFLTLEEKAGSIDSEATRMNLTSNDIVDYFVFENIDINEIYTQL